MFCAAGRMGLRQSPYESLTHRQYKLAENAIEMRLACFAASSFAAVTLVLLGCCFAADFQ